MTADQSTIDNFGKESPPRYDWDYQALDSFFLLAEHYHQHRKLNRLLAEFGANLLNEARHWFYTPITRLDTSGAPPVVTVENLLKPEKLEERLTGTYDWIEDRFNDTWIKARQSLGDASPSLREVSDVAFEYGLRSDWGPGFLLEMVLAYPDNPHREVLWGGPWFVRRSIIHMLRSMNFTYSPDPSPGMSEADLKAELDKQRRDELAAHRRLRSKLIKRGVWKVKPPQLSQHVEWLFKRICPADDVTSRNSYRNPRALAAEYGVSDTTIRAGCRKAAKLLRIEIPRGVIRDSM